MAFQRLHLACLTTVLHNVKILAINSSVLNLDMTIDLMKCFPCLEKLYIKCPISGGRNLWRRKHKHIIQCFDIHLKTVVTESYRGMKLQINFASFFVLNARELQVMWLEVGLNDYNECLVEQNMMLHMEEGLPEVLG